MSFLREYGMFLLETVTVVVAMLAVVAGVAAAGIRLVRRPGRPGLEVRDLTRTYEDLAFSLRAQTLPAKAAKTQGKALKR